MADGEPERLHPMEVFDGPRLDTQSDQLVQPRHQLAGPVLAESENLRWLGIDRGRELQCIEPVLQEADVLPEHLIKRVVGLLSDEFRNLKTFCTLSPIPGFRRWLDAALSGEVSVTIAAVYPNGTMLVRGEKLLTLNRGDERVQISGIVRAMDISPDNRILSTRVADANIRYVGKGEIARASKQGWLQRFFSIISPF